MSLVLTALEPIRLFHLCHECWIHFLLCFRKLNAFNDTRPLYEVVACVDDGLDGGGGAAACPVVVGLHDVLVAVAVVLPDEICMA